MFSAVIHWVAFRAGCPATSSNESVQNTQPFIPGESAGRLSRDRRQLETHSWRNIAITLIDPWDFECNRPISTVDHLSRAPT